MNAVVTGVPGGKAPGRKQKNINAAQYELTGFIAGSVRHEVGKVKDNLELVAQGRGSLRLLIDSIAILASVDQKLTAWQKADQLRTDYPYSSKVGNA